MYITGHHQPPGAVPAAAPQVDELVAALAHEYC